MALVLEFLVKEVEYIMENFNKPEWQNLTLEAIENESG
jgi:hypothetical protein